MSTDTRPNSPTPVIRNHPDYYLPGGDLFIKVDNTLFRVHLYFFTRESDLWRNLLGSTTQGRTANHPIDLVQQLNCYPTPTADTFANFLWVFYNPRYSIYNATQEVWEKIHDHAVGWHFREIERLSWREIDRIQGNPGSDDGWYDNLDQWSYIWWFDPEEDAIRRHIEDDHERS
jgi:hypothetical protein